MTHFAGLDVSLEESAICVVDETGRIIKEMRAVSRASRPYCCPNGTRPSPGAHRPGGVLADGMAARWASCSGSPDPIMRRPCADREEKRVTRGSDTAGSRKHRSGDACLTNPNQRRHLEVKGPVAF